MIASSKTVIHTRNCCCAVKVKTCGYNRWASGFIGHWVLNLCGTFSAGLSHAATFEAIQSMNHAPLIEASFVSSSLLLMHKIQGKN